MTEIILKYNFAVQWTKISSLRYIFILYKANKTKVFGNINKPLAYLADIRNFAFIHIIYYNMYYNITYLYLNNGMWDYFVAW